MKRILFVLLFATIINITNAQSIKFSVEEWNFGSINSGDSVIVNFGFINGGDKDLNISSINSSCECMKTFWPTNAIKPNDTAIIKLSYSSIGKMGMQDKKAVILSNSTNENPILHLNGNVQTKDLFNASTSYTGKTFKEWVPAPRPLDSLKSFWSIPFGSSKSFAIKTMKAKGIILEEKTEGKTTTLSASNIIFSNQKVFLMDLRLVDDKFYESILLFKTQTPQIREDFERIADNLNIKYFKGENHESYKSPYDQIKGHEEDAIALGYGKLSCYWMFADQKGIILKTLKIENNIYLALGYQDGNLIDEASGESMKTNDY